MHRIDKELKKFTARERLLIRKMLEQLISGDTNNIDIKKLKGVNDIFRIRKGKIRIIYRVEKNKFFILAIEKRGKKTYKRYR